MGLTVTGHNIFGEPVTVTVSGTVIHSVRSPEPTETVPRDLWVLPGLVDLQVNGFAGHDLNGEGVTPDTVKEVVRALWPHGVTRFCPTVCTASHEQMITALRAVACACDEIEWVDRAVVGIHVEGPYISPEDGPRGAHSKDYVRDPDWAEVQAFQDAAGGRIRLFTLAPECPGALDLIERLSRSGIVPAIGHTNATRDDILAAVRAGARLSTHLGNGAHAMLPRHPNYIWEQLAADALWATLIVDGHHLPPSVVKVFVRAKGIHRCVLVSDAVWLAGQTPGTYQCLSGPVELTADQMIRVAGTQYLAGSALDLGTAVVNAVSFAGIGMADAVEMASHHPAMLLHRPELGTLVPGSCADILLARWPSAGGGLEIVQTIAGGEVVYAPQLGVGVAEAGA
ncbi:MAG TPA: amidohydrolase family protein [bacterium]|nr:amidohydrolase family protein [bacterium]